MKILEKSEIIFSASEQKTPTKTPSFIFNKSGNLKKIFCCSNYRIGLIGY